MNPRHLPIFVARATASAMLVVPAHPAAGQAQEPLARAFLSPPSTARPWIRNWTPQAAVTDKGLRAEIDALSQQGFGGVEIVAMPAPKAVPSDYDWGTRRWNAAMIAATDEAARRGLKISLTNGPAWPIAMPALKSADDPGALYELTYGLKVLQPGERYDGPVPARRKVRPEGTPHLAAVLAYRMAGDHTLDQSSMRDLTSTVIRPGGADGTAALSFIAPAGGPWAVLSFWEQPAAQKVDGLYVIDHLSAAGAQASADYWQGALQALGPARRALTEIFNDSMEYQVAMEWTRGFRAVFRAQHGYDITPYLPFIGRAQTFPANDIAGFASLDPEVGRRVNQDYLSTLTFLYMTNHLGGLQTMAERHGLTLRYQEGYNKPYEVETAALAVGIPETEALGRAALDGLRQMAGAVHLTGKPYLSIETSAEFHNNYGQTLEDILWWNKRAWAAGINRETLHGAAYGGAYDGPGNVGGFLPGVSWPGFAAFQGMVSNVWNRPVDPAALRRTTDYIARINWVMQKTAKVDLAVYRHGLDIFVDLARPSVADGDALVRDGGVLNGAGFSYDLLTPTLLSLPQARMADGRLAAKGPAYRALIVADEPAMALSTLQRITALARAGLKVVLVGATPERGLSRADALRGETDDQVKAAAAALMALPGVRHAATYADAPGALRALGVRPDAEEDPPADVLSQHRIGGGGDFYYLYNYNRVVNLDARLAGPRPTLYPDIDKSLFKPRTVHLSLMGQGRPYLLDAWSGEVRALPAYQSDGKRVRLTLDFLGDEALVVALLTNDQAKAAGLALPSARRLGAEVVANGPVGYDHARLEARLTREAAAGFKAGLKVPPQDIPAAFPVPAWTLDIQSLEPPENGSPDFAASVRRKLPPIRLAGDGLKPWRRIAPDLARVSGSGAYSATFTLPARPRLGAYLNLGKVAGAFTIAVNGIDLKGLDQLNTRVDIGPYVRAGLNRVTVSVVSTLYNRVNGPEKDYGLLGMGGHVILEPYRLYPLRGVSAR